MKRWRKVSWGAMCRFGQRPECGVGESPVSVRRKTFQCRAISKSTAWGWILLVLLKEPQASFHHLRTFEQPIYKSSFYSQPIFLKKTLAPLCVSGETRTPNRPFTSALQVPWSHLWQLSPYFSVFASDIYILLQSQLISLWLVYSLILKVESK